jgi:hypothetical protein
MEAANRCAAEAGLSLSVSTFGYDIRHEALKRGT